MTSIAFFVDTWLTFWSQGKYILLEIRVASRSRKNNKMVWCELALTFVLAGFACKSNTDTYIETMHREFFKKMGDGVDPHNCFTEGESCLSALTLAFPVVLHGIVAGLPIETVHTRAVHHVGLFTRAPLINRRLRVLVWLVRELLEAGSEARASLRTAFEVLTLGQDAEVIGDIDNLLNKDDTDLFWGLERDALGKGECGENRGGTSVFSIS